MEKWEKRREKKKLIENIEVNIRKGRGGVDMSNSCINKDNQILLNTSAVEIKEKPATGKEILLQK